jgi:N-acetylmuramoyl-L-alanine amidase
MNKDFNGFAGFPPHIPTGRIVDKQSKAGYGRFWQMMSLSMNKPWKAGTACVVVLLVLFGPGLNPARSEDNGAQAVKSAACQRSAFRVIVDVGHTEAKPGADSARGVPEYTFNLRLADAITQALQDAGYDKTVRMMTTTAPWMGLVERATRANAMHAALFIAIHHDSVPDRLIETWQYDGKENHFSDRFNGYAIFISNDNADRAGSVAFGHDLGKALQARGLHYTPHYTLPLMGRHRHELVDAEAGVYRYDQLLVLRKTQMPAVLLEAGSIVNRQEELELATPERRALVADAVTAAVEEFCAARAQAVSAAVPARPRPAAIAR